MLRHILQEKLSVAGLLERTSQRAEANYELAARLAQRIGALQQELVALLGKGVMAAAGPEGVGSSGSSSTSSSSSSWSSSSRQSYRWVSCLRPW